MSPLAPPTQPFAQGVNPVTQAWGAARQEIDKVTEGAQGGLSGAQVARIHRTAEDFEAVFLGEMLSPMFESLETDGLFGGGSGERMYRSLLVQEYGKSLARNGGVGIADAVTRQVLALQEIDR